MKIDKAIKEAKEKVKEWEGAYKKDSSAYNRGALEGWQAKVKDLEFWRDVIREEIKKELND